MNSLKPWVFWPPFLILVLSAGYSWFDPENFLSTVTYLNDQLLHYFGWLFSTSALAFLGIVIWAYFSPLGKIRIGGAKATPLLTRWRWFSITLCTTIAIGILFWGTAEPLFHLHEPPLGLGIEPNSPAAARFAISTMFMHWTFIPYGIYTLAGLMFALTYYNLKQPYSLGALFYPLLGKRVYGPFSNAIDAICLYSLVAGMAASLGAGILTLSGGVETILGIPDTPITLGILTFMIVASFIVSAASGLMNGIRILSDINIKFFMGLAAFVLIFGPTMFILSFGIEGFGEYLQHFFERSLYTGAAADDSWANSWTIFYWANWLAWTPITALFLGRLALGYTVREFIQYNLFYPSIFGCIWMMIFSGTAIHMDFYADGQPMYDILQEGGPQMAIFALFDRLPMSGIVSVLFLLISFLSYVTAADSNTTAMGGICSTGISPESPEPALWIKIAWGATVGTIAWVMITFAGIDGIKITSNLGGLPALFVVLVVAGGIVKLIRNPRLLE